jgi:hypothetical protein
MNSLDPFGFGLKAGAGATPNNYNFLQQMYLDPQIEPLLRGQNAVQNAKRFFDLRFGARFTDESVRPGLAAISLLNFIFSTKCDVGIRLTAAQLFYWIVDKHWVRSFLLLISLLYYNLTICLIFLLPLTLCIKRKIQRVKTGKME